MSCRILLLVVALGLGPLSRVTAAPVVELFTSQGCYSCPPADEFLADLIDDKPEVVALEFHVDYWDDLNYGSAGTWKDPFSDASFSLRQRQYNARQLQGRRGVYTPQMIVNGHTAEVGTSRLAVIEALRRAKPPLDMSVTQSGTQITITASDGSVQSDPTQSQATIWLAVFDRKQETEVINGENHGKTMLNHNVVRQLTPISPWDRKRFAQTINVPALAEANAGCAVLIQTDDQELMLAAEYCTSES